MAAHTCPFAVRMREASSRPKREYKPKAREPFDLGEPEQSNGGFPCTPAPTVTGNRSRAVPGPQSKASIQTVVPGAPCSPCRRGPQGWDQASPTVLSLPLCFVCKQLRRLSALLTSPSGPRAGACVSVPLPQFITLPSSLFWKGLSHSASLVEGGSHCGRYSQPLASRDGAGARHHIPASPCARGTAVTPRAPTRSRLSEWHPEGSGLWPS